MLWMISAVTTPLALAVYLFVIDWNDLVPWSNIRTIPMWQRVLGFINFPLLCFIAWAFLVGTYILMVSAFIIIIIISVLFSIDTMTTLLCISKYSVLNIERMITGVLIALMVISAIQAM